MDENEKAGVVLDIVRVLSSIVSLCILTLGAEHPVTKIASRALVDIETYNEKIGDAHG